MIYSGKPLKSINHYYSQKSSEYKSRRDIIKDKNYCSKKLANLSFKRMNKIKGYMHQVSRKITNQLVESGVTTLVIGYNKNWKQDVNLGKKTNQNFVFIPFRMFINQLTYKCNLEGITVVEIQENYTSKSSFLDDEPIEKKEKYSGRRIERGLYQSNSGKIINADVNGGLNILKLYYQSKAAWTTVLHRDCVKVCSTPSICRDLFAT